MGGSHYGAPLEGGFKKIPGSENKKTITVLKQATITIGRLSIHITATGFAANTIAVSQEVELSLWKATP